MTLAPRGLDIVLDKGGERVRHFLVGLAKDKPVPNSVMKKIRHLGTQLGLSESEVDTTVHTSRSRLLIALPIVVVIILVIIAIIFNWEQIVNSIYLPGTLYDTIQPNDFNGNVRGSKNLFSN
jgi:hypothetical protein